MALLVVLTCLATYRLTRLLTTDDLTEPWRDAVDSRFGEDSKLTYLVNCPWCVGVYVGALVAWLTDLWVAGGLQAPVLVWGTASAVTGLIASVEPA